MAKPRVIRLPDGQTMPVLFEDRSVMAVDKPPGWIVSANWKSNPEQNLQLFLESSIYHREFWAMSRNLKFLRFIHRLDSPTSGVLLLSKSLGAIAPLSKLFEAGRMEKEYLAVVDGVPSDQEWMVEAWMDRDEDNPGQWMIVPEPGKNEETNSKLSMTRFSVLDSRDGKSLILAKPATGRTHQIRVHLAHSGNPISNDPLYNPKVKGKRRPKGERKENPASMKYSLGLRATKLSYFNPFQRKKVIVKAPASDFLAHFGFPPESASMK